MKILLINYEYPPIGAGAANATYHIARQLVLQKHEVVVLTAGFGERQGLSNEDGIWVYRVKSRRKSAFQSNMKEMLSFVWKAFLALGAVIEQFKPNASIVFFSVPCGPLGWWGKVRYRLPYIVSLRGGDVPGNDASLVKMHARIAPVRRYILKKSIAVVANSETAAAMSFRADGIKTLTIPNGVDTRFYSSVSGIEPYMQILFVGRLAPEKNVISLLEVFLRIIRNLPVLSDFKLIIVGDGPLRAELEKFCADNELRELVHFRGWINKNELRGLYQESWCMVNPSFSEGMPNTVLEAMSCGLPVIASKVAGNADIITHRVNGMLFNLDNSEALFTGLLELMMDMSLRAKLGAQARLHIVQNFSWFATAEAYAKLIGE